MNRKRMVLCVVCFCMFFAVPAAADQLRTIDPFEQQNAVDAALLAELENGWSLEEAPVILDPYGKSPLTAMIVFSTQEETDVTVTVCGKEKENDITGHFPAAKDHLIPVYGLYNGDTTQVEVVLGDGSSRVFEVETEKLEIPVGEIAVEMYQPQDYDYGQITIVCSLGGFLYGIDAAGDIRWYYTDCGTMGVHPLKNGHLMTPSSFTVRPMYYKSGLQEIDLNGRVYANYLIPGGQHHDFQELENGNLLVAGDQPDLSIIEDYVVEIDRQTGEVVWELDMKDILPVDDGMSASMNTDGTEESDWFHNNSLWYDAAHDLVLLSGRHKDAIVAVNKKDKTLAWILGDPDGWEELDSSCFFTPEGENFEWFYAQHQITMLENGDIMLFDNGTAKVKRYEEENRVSGDGVYSRAVIYHIDTENMTVSQVYEYGKERGAEWYSDWISGVESLDGTKDALWITAGSHLYDPHADNHGLGPADMFLPDLVKSTHMDLVTDGALACEITVEGDTYASLTYRSLRCPLYGENSTCDPEIPAVTKGTLGESMPLGEEAVALLSLQEKEAQSLQPESWSFTRDLSKVSFTGNYTTNTPANEIKGAYLILEKGQETRVYQAQSNAAEGKNGTGVSVTGWVSMQGLEGEWDILLLLDGQLYDTGFEL